MLDRLKIDGTWGEIHGNPLENEGFHGNNAVETMPCLPPMTGNGKHIHP